MINKDDLHDCRFVESAVPELGEGEALLRVDSFGLTSNNITYAVFGESMSYWNFFPADQEWGRMPVWGFAEVVHSADAGLPAGTRLYGYLPPSTHLVVQPDRVDERGFVDAAPHRAGLPSAYQGYRRVDADPVYDEGREDEQVLFWPLFYTSFLVDDFLADEGFFGADTIVVSSASSKTALIAAYLLARRAGIGVNGLTSQRNAGFVERLGVYEAVFTYDEVESLPGEKAVYVDVSGDGGVRASVHARYGERLAHSSTVGATHWEELAAGSGELPGPRPTFFFAPDRIRKRGADWGTPTLEARVAEAWAPFAEWAGEWLEVRHVEEPEAVKRAYLALLEGEIDPGVGHVATLSKAEKGPRSPGSTVPLS